MSVSHEIRKELEEIATRCGCELLDVAYRGGVLQLIVDRDGGVAVADCSNVSREASAYLDVVDFGRGHYTLEVSSPGLDREFYSEADYQRFLGEQVRVSWIDDDRKRTDTALLKDYRPNPGSKPEIEVELDHEVRTIQLDRVIKTRLEPTF